MIRWVAAGIAAAVVFLAGCAKAPAKPYGGELPDLVYGRVISLSPNVTELITLVNADHKLVGRTSRCDYPDTPSLRATPIVANPNPDMDKIIRLQPDLIIVDQNMVNPSYLEQFKRANIEVLVLKINSVKDWIAAVETIGNKLLMQKQASDVVDEAKTAMHLGETDPIVPKPKVLIAMDAERPMAAGLQSYQADVVRVAGGEPVGPDADKFVPISPEQIVQWNPDAIIVPGMPDRYLHSPAFAATKAAKNGAVIGVNENHLLRAGAKLKDLIRAVHQELMRTSHTP
jgi:iron complex transport system substrate-binding protein